MTGCGVRMQTMQQLLLCNCGAVQCLLHADCRICAGSNLGGLGTRPSKGDEFHMLVIQGTA